MFRSVKLAQPSGSLPRGRAAEYFGKSQKATPKMSSVIHPTTSMCTYVGQTTRNQECSALPGHCMRTESSKPAMK
jgi:hypothetical protein